MSAPSTFWIPPEIVHEIATWCSKDSLAALARTCVVYCPEAEKQLYEDVGVVTVECLHTLLVNPRKKGYVRHLTAVYQKSMEGIHGPRGLTMLVRLCEILPELQSLTTLRLFEQSIRRSSTYYHINMGIGRLVMRLEEVLNKGIFPRLRTIHCDRCFLKDVGLLFKSRPSLQVFSTDLLDPIELRVLQEMEHNHTESIPAIYVEDSVPELFVQVMVFPGLYSPARVPSILKALENHWRHLEQQVIRLYIYIAGPTQIEVYISAKDSCAIIPNCRNVRHLNLLLERPYDIPAGEVVDIVGALPALVELTFMRHSLDNSAELEQIWQTAQRTAKSENERIAKVQAWSNACPSLRPVTFSTTGEDIVHEIH